MELNADFYVPATLPQESAPGTHLIGYVGPRAGLDAFGEYRKNLLRLSGTESPFVGCPGRSLINIPTILSRLPSLLLVEYKNSVTWTCGR